MKLILFILFCSSVAVAEVPLWQDKLDAYVAELPKDVTALLKRMDECEHWGGEEPYDDARKQEITEAVGRLKCDDVAKDRAKILKKYKKKPKIVDKIEKFPAALD
jgi:hypothetical protein